MCEPVFYVTAQQSQRVQCATAIGEVRISQQVGYQKQEQNRAEQNNKIKN